MTNPNPSPELQPCPNPWCSGSDPVVERTLRYMGDDSPRRVDCQCGQLGPVKPTEAEAITAWNTRAALSQTPSPPSLSTDVQSAATGVHEHDVSLKVAMPAPGEVERQVLLDLQNLMAKLRRNEISGYEYEPQALAILARLTEPPLATVAAGDDEGDWQPIETAPRDGTLVLALYRDNGLFVYALTHYRSNRDGTEGWYDGTIPAAKPPLAWQPLPDIAAAIRLLSQGEGK